MIWLGGAEEQRGSVSSVLEIKWIPAWTLLEASPAITLQAGVPGHRTGWEIHKLEAGMRAASLWEAKLSALLFHRSGLGAEMSPGRLFPAIVCMC